MLVNCSFPRQPLRNITRQTSKPTKRITKYASPTPTKKSTITKSYPPILISPFCFALCEKGLILLGSKENRLAVSVNLLESLLT